MSYSAPTNSACPQRQRHLRLLAVAAVATIAAFSAACLDDSSSDALPSAAASQVNSTAEQVNELVLTADGFLPDSIELDEGTVLIFRNDSGDDVTLSLTGTEDGDQEFEVKAGATLDLPMSGSGARIITVPGDTELTATVMVRSTASPEAE